VATEKKELIHLDAEILRVLTCSAFGARLENRHEFVALEDAGGFTGPPPRPGDRVRVSFTPYDMSTARIESILESEA